MARRTARQARALGIWTATWLFVLLLIGVLWLGDLSLQWPVLLVPVVWALVAVRPRGRSRVRAPEDDEPWQPDRPDRGVPPTREMPQLPEVPRRRED